MTAGIEKSTRAVKKLCDTAHSRVKVEFTRALALSHSIHERITLFIASGFPWIPPCPDPCAVRPARRGAG